MGPIHRRKASDIRHGLLIIVPICDVATVPVCAAAWARTHRVAAQAGTLTPTHEGARRVAARWESVPAGEPQVGEIGTAGTKGDLVTADPLRTVTSGLAGDERGPRRVCHRLLIGLHPE